MSPSLRRLLADDAVGQLRRRDGRMADLGSEGDVPKLDWVEGVARLLRDDAALEGIEDDAAAMRARGIRHVIWAGMGGSVIAVRVLTELGLCGAHGMDGDGQDGDGEEQEQERIVIHPLDSTDPAALNAIVRRIAASKGLALPSLPSLLPSPATERGVGGEGAPATERGVGGEGGPAHGRGVGGEGLSRLLDDVLMVGVSMGMTSEEPITHLEWFAALLTAGGLDAATHLLVMTLPGSYLDRFAHQHGVPSRPLQPDGGTGTGGRMSAPATRVFLLPAALALANLTSERGALRAVLRAAWQAHDLDLAADRPAEHPFVQLAAALSDAAVDGACRLLLDLPDRWRPLLPWIEQLLEESLGKGGKGVVVFDDQSLNPHASGYQADGTLRVRVVNDATRPTNAESDAFVLSQPLLAATAPRDQLAACAASFLGWQLAMALYAYPHDITFAGQPAVEDYKARARALRSGSDDPLHAVISSHRGATVTEGPLTLLVPPGLTAADAVGATSAPSPADLLAAVLQQAPRRDGRERLAYLDLTYNGEPPSGWERISAGSLRRLGNSALGVPVKPRRAPAAYHSTEQSEMDGPPGLISLRALALRHEPCLVGAYDDTFLRAQAVSTWQTMTAQGRPCLLLLVDGAPDEALLALNRLLDDTAERIGSPGNEATEDMRAAWHG